LHSILYSDIKDYVVEEHQSKKNIESSAFKFVGHMLKSDVMKDNTMQFIHVHLPLQAHVHMIQLREIHKIAQMHDIVVNTKNFNSCKDGKDI
jgi:hypothetical protein